MDVDAVKKSSKKAPRTPKRHAGGDHTDKPVSVDNLHQLLMYKHNLYDFSTPGSSNRLLSQFLHDFIRVVLVMRYLHTFSPLALTCLIAMINFNTLHNLHCLRVAVGILVCGSVTMTTALESLV